MNHNAPAYGTPSYLKSVRGGAWGVIAKDRSNNLTERLLVSIIPIDTSRFGIIIAKLLACTKEFT